MHTFSIRLGLALVLILTFFAAKGVAADHTQLTPLLVDLKGWKADPAGGMTMDMGSSKMVNAAREYRQGDREINAMVMLGNQAMAQGSMQAMKAENAEGKMSISTIDGFKVMSQYNKTEKSGAVIVYLSQQQQQGAMFTLVYKGLSEKEGLETAKKFNWKEMKSSVDKLF
jgi:ABC-type sugar transport system substrate-binding protein